MALSSIAGNKLRSGLTILGVMVGVGSVIGMAAIIDGLNLAAQESIDALGSNVIYISKFAPDTDWEKLTDEERNRAPITVGEAQAIEENCSLVDGVAPRDFIFLPGGNEAKYKNRKFNRPMVFGTWPAYDRVRMLNLESGRFLSEVDEQFKGMVCVIGYDISEVLFEGEEPIDRMIRVNGQRFRVVGVLEEWKATFDDDGDNRNIIIPLSTFLKLYPWEKELGLMARAVSYSDIEGAKDEITSTLRQFRRVPFNKKDSFSLTTQDNIKDIVKGVTDAIYLAMIVITSVGLMVGGIGVMNIMLVSVTERTREIGVRKAIGAKRTNIILQFLTEATTLSGTGGVIGVVSGVALGGLVNSLLGFPQSLSVFWIILGFGVAVGVGLVSGIYPAVKAARLDPIEALRYE